MILEVNGKGSWGNSYVATWLCEEMTEVLEDLTDVVQVLRRGLRVGIRFVKNDRGKGIKGGGQNDFLRSRF